MCKFSPIHEIKVTDMHLTNQFGFKCSHLNFGSANFSVYFYNKNSEKYQNPSVESVGYLFYLYRGFIFWVVALQWPNLHIHTISERLQISKKKRALIMHICQLWFAELVKSTRASCWPTSAP